MQLTDKQKYEIIILYERKYSIAQIAEDMKINKNTVSRWLKRYTDTKLVERQVDQDEKKN